MAPGQRRPAENVVLDSLSTDYVSMIFCRHSLLQEGPVDGGDDTGLMSDNDMDLSWDSLQWVQDGQESTNEGKIDDVGYFLFPSTLIIKFL